VKGRNAILLSANKFGQLVMETQHVRYFLAICDELSFTRAAQKCGIKQPTLSEAIKQMEQFLGGELFVRATPVRLTALGFLLRPICVQINELLENARVMSTSLKEPAPPLIQSKDVLNA
jgi:LysR family transcriptional regulator, hydrogen peroxide-inducible genes activator